MVTDRQYRRFMKLIQEEQTLATAAAKAGMDEKTARKYRDLKKLPSQTKRQRTWRTRKDAFEEVWPEVVELPERDEAIEAKTIFEYLNRVRDSWAWEFGVLPPGEALAKAKAAANRALTLDPLLAAGHTAAGYTTLHYDWNPEKACREFEQAIALNPDWVDAHHWHSHVLYYPIRISNVLQTPRGHCRSTSRSEGGRSKEAAIARTIPRNGRRRH
jgi:hypothetical protein